jgi:hypothetical protein
VVVGEANDISVGDMGVEEAIVPPTPTRDVTGTILRGAGVGDVLGMRCMRAGLCGDPIDMTKGMLELDAVLSLRDGVEGR